MTRRRRYRCWRCPSGTDAARRARLGRAWDVSDFLSDFKISLSYTVDRGSRVPCACRRSKFGPVVKFLSLDRTCRKKLRQLLSAGEGTLFRLVARDRRSPSPRSACARATRTGGPMFLSEDAFDLDGDGAGCVPPPPLSPSSAPRPWSFAGVVSPSTRHPRRRPMPPRPPDSRGGARLRRTGARRRRAGVA